MRWVQWVGFAGGLLVVISTAGSLTRALVVPRGLTSRLAFMSERITRAIFLMISGWFHDYRAKDRILALLGPISMFALLVTWIVSFMLGYALMLWPLEAGSFHDAIRASGSAMFTLGFSVPHTHPAMYVQFIAAATGLIVVALQIAYLPTLYAAFNRREMLVTTLATRAGLPAWGPEILARHQLVRTIDALRPFYADWERWAADVGESHSNYPVLNYFRSPHPLRNWLLGLLATMDSAAMYLALCPSSVPSEARLMLRMGFVALRDIGAALGMEFDPDPLPNDPIQLTFEEFERGVARTAEVGFEIERTPAEAWQHFHGWRVNYEQIAYALADRIVAPPAAWSGVRTHVPGDPIPLQRPADRRPEQPGERTPRGAHWRV